MRKLNRKGRVVFTRKMRKTHTLLMPNMLPMHFQIIQNVLCESGYRVELLRSSGPHLAQIGLQYVHNDTCYPAMLVVGQMIDALRSGRYDVNRTALLMTQTGGGCRASNYIHLIRKALVRAGFGQVPVISVNLSGMEPNPGFRITLPMLRKVIAAIAYGDELMLLSNQARPYERHPGSTDQLLAEWTQRIADRFHAGKGYGLRQVKRVMVEIAESFAALPLLPAHRTKVGIVGEIYIKYASLGNNDLEAFLQRQGCEYRIPGVMGFVLFSLDNRLEDRRLYGGKWLVSRFARVLTWYVKLFETALIRALEPTHFLPPAPFAHVRELVRGVIGHGSKMGEGWLLTAEMLELAEQGYENIICTQPFGCLPNHINGRGMMNRVKAIAPRANIVAIDYDPSAAPVNQENRIKLMLASAAGEGPAEASSCVLSPEALETDGMENAAPLQTADQSAWS